MDIKDLLEGLKDLDSDRLDNRLDQLVRTNYRFQNLSSENKKLVLSLVKKYRDYLKRGVGISDSAVDRECYKLYSNRSKLGLTEEDLKDIREILEAFRK